MPRVIFIAILKITYDFLTTKMPAIKTRTLTITGVQLAELTAISIPKKLNVSEFCSA